MLVRKVLVHVTVLFSCLCISFIIMYNILDDLLLPIFHGNLIFYLACRFLLAIFLYSVFFIIITGMRAKNKQDGN